MGKILVLFDKIYNITSERNRKEVFIKYLKYLRESIKGFPNTTIEIRKLRNFDSRFEIFISGPEEVFVFNLLKKEVGSIQEFREVKVGSVYKGNLVDVGKVGFGIFVDCAILNPKVDVLITLHTLRDQLGNAKKVSLRDIIKIYDFIDHFPVNVKITKINQEERNLQGEISDDFLTLYKKVLNANIEGIFVSGATKNQFKKALLKEGHFRDIISIKRYRFLENIVLLKQNTDAPGIISNIGKHLENCKLSAIRPSRIRPLLS